MDVNYEAWAVELCTLLDQIEMVATGGPKFETIMGQPARTLTERLRDNSHGDEIELSLLSDDAEIAADALDAVQTLSQSRHGIAEQYGLEVVHTGTQPGGVQ